MKTHLCLPGIRPHARAICGLKEPKKRSILHSEVDCGHCLRIAVNVRRALVRKWQAEHPVP